MTTNTNYQVEEKGLLKELVSYMIPGITGLLFNSLYIVVDGLFVARMLGRESFAAVTVGVPAVEILLAISMLISVGAGVLISSNKGQGKNDEARAVFNMSVKVLVGVALIIGVTTLIFIEPLVKMMGATPDIMDLAVTYMKYFLMFIPAFMFSYAMATWLRNDTQPKLAMTALIVGAFSNVFLDWFFMGPMNMGIAGAAIATGLGPVFGIMIMMPHFISRRGILSFEKVKLNGKILLEMFTKGLPSFTMEFALGITALCVNIAISKHLDSLGFAAYGIIGYIALIAMSIFLGMAEGTQPLISYYHGANMTLEIKEILKISVILSTVIGIIVYALLYVFAEVPVSLFAYGDNELIKTATRASLFYFPTLFVSGINIVVSSYVQSIGKWKHSVVISLSRSLIILMPLY